MNSNGAGEGIDLLGYMKKAQYGSVSSLHTRTQTNYCGRPLVCPQSGPVGVPRRPASDTDACDMVSTCGVSFSDRDVSFSPGDQHAA